MSAPMWFCHYARSPSHGGCIGSPGSRLQLGPELKSVQSRFNIVIRLSDSRRSWETVRIAWCVLAFHYLLYSYVNGLHHSILQNSDLCYILDHFQQTERYQIVEELGCSVASVKSTQSLAIIYVWTVVFPAISAIFYCRTWLNLQPST